MDYPALINAAKARDKLRDALRSANVRAFLRVIREGESDQTPNAYRKRVGDGPGVYSLDSLADHPRRLVRIERLKLSSSAAGAYQFLQRTWDMLVNQYGFEDFGPACQDEAAVALILGRQSLDAIISGDLYTTLDRCSWEWASLPPNRYGQGAMTAERTFETYDRYGGHYGVSADVPHTDVSLAG